MISRRPAKDTRESTSQHTMPYHHYLQTPAFSSTHVRSLTPIFRQSATQVCSTTLYSHLDLRICPQLRDIWLAQADAHTRDSSTTSPRVDALMWLSRATLDIIGLAGTPYFLTSLLSLISPPGFGYNFNSVQNAASGTPVENELANAFSIIFSTARKFRTITVLQVWFPFLRIFVCGFTLYITSPHP
jgi:hypothetical protein